MTSLQLMDQHKAADTLLKYVHSGILGSTKGIGVYYALMHTTDSTLSYSVTLEPVKYDPLYTLDRYQIEIDRQTGELSALKKIEITDKDIEEAILAATNEPTASSSRFTDGGFSISYKATTNRPDAAYVVQLRHYGNVASMDA